MTTGWDWDWEYDWGTINLTVDLCEWMIGVAWSRNDMCIRPLPCVLISFDWWTE
jgi:hypothetical protein